MKDVDAIIGGAASGMLRDLRFQYLRLEVLTPQERDKGMVDAIAKMNDIAAEIAAEETRTAILTLLRFHYVTRFVYDVEQLRRSRKDFLDRVASNREDRDILAWEYTTPPWNVFLPAVLERLNARDFYQQVQAVCSDNVGGLSIPEPTLTFTGWCDHVHLSEPRWASKYDQRVRDEKARWFSSTKRIAAIEAERVVHRARVEWCMNELEPLFTPLQQAKPRLEDLKRRELFHDNYMTPLKRAYEALQAGVSLKHLLLEEAHEWDAALAKLSK